MCNQVKVRNWVKIVKSKFHSKKNNDDTEKYPLQLDGWRFRPEETLRPWPLPDWGVPVNCQDSNSSQDHLHWWAE